MSGGFASTGYAGFTGGGGGGSARTVRDDNGGSGYTATNTMALPDADVVLFTTGGTVATFAAPGTPRAPTTLECQDRLTLTDGTGNILLAGDHDAIIEFGETITLESDGSTWFEVGRGADGQAPTHVTHSGNQSISDSSTTTLAFDTERYDANARHDPSTLNSRIKALYTGKYRVWGRIAWANNTTGTRMLSIWKNATNEVDRDWRPASTGGSAYSTNHVDVTVSLARNDYVELKAYQDSGGPLNVITLDQASPEFGVEWMGR